MRHRDEGLDDDLGSVGRQGFAAQAGGQVELGARQRRRGPVDEHRHLRRVGGGDAAVAAARIAVRGLVVADRRHLEDAVQIDARRAGRVTRPADADEPVADAEHRRRLR